MDRHTNGRSARPGRGTSEPSNIESVTPTATAQGPRSLVAQVAATVPVKFRAGFLKATEGKCSPRAAIKAKCLDCANYTIAEVTHCTVVACPLWSLRPFRKAREGSEPAEGSGSGVEVDRPSR